MRIIHAHFPGCQETRGKVIFMKRQVLVGLALMLTLLIGAPPLVAQQGQQPPPQQPRLGGTWDVHIIHYTGRIVDEQWIVTHDGNTITGKVVVRSGREFPLEGTVDGFRIKWKVTTQPAANGQGERYHYFIGAADNMEISGTLERHDHSDDGTFAARRARS
jgi:hypothetical protein